MWVSLDFPDPQGSMRYREARTTPRTSPINRAFACSTEVEIRTHVPRERFVLQDLSSEKSRVGCGTMLFRTYWNISVWVSSFSTERHLRMSSSHRWRSLIIRLRTSSGGASTSTQNFHKRRGWPSPTFLYARSTSPREAEYEIHPLNFSRDSWINY